MRKQLLFCVETDREADVDWVYIHETIKYCYGENNEISIKPIYMGGKTNYKTNKVLNEIKDKSKRFKGETTVFYCIDTDRMDINATQELEFNAIKKYCSSKGYNFIWFSRDVEDVFWGSQVEDSEKKNKAKQFRSQKQIQRIRFTSLRATSVSRHKSNILNVLDKYLI